MRVQTKALLMALVLMFTTVFPFYGTYPNVAKAEGTAITVVFHLYCEDGNYNKYGQTPQLYHWTTSDGVANDMAISENEATYTYEVDAATLKVGWIIRWGNSWDHKDVNIDRFVDLTNVVGGTVHIYATSGVAEFDQNNDDAIIGAKLTSATCSQDLMSIVLTSAVDLSDEILNSIKVRDDKTDNYIAINEITSTGEKEYTIKLDSKLDITGIYKVEYDGDKSISITMPDYYATEEFVEKYFYPGDDLGATWSADSTTFRVWAPLATDVQVNLYASGTAGTDDLIKSVAMAPSDKGTWVVTVDGDLNGTYYTYTATVNGIVQKDIVDPYARTTGVNGDRGMVIDLDSTDPEKWEKDKNPFTSTNYTDAVIYELHVRDFSIDESSGMINKGKYLAFTETGTKNSHGQSTGINYLKDLGITHVHLLPVYDYASVDETKLDTPQFNWGYDPKNFNTPEGSYATDPYNGAVRVTEFKKMIQSLHNAGIAVVMDVVYGHVANSSSFCINRLTPGYYTRPDSNASGCGNDTATEREMNRKYIVDSMVYWATEYHINGFRIDQEGLFDVETINACIEALHKIDPSIIIYGEGWDMSSTKPTKDVQLAGQKSARDTIGSAYFNDSVRDAIKGGVFDIKPGYVTGNYERLSDILNAIVAKPGWEFSPSSVVNFNSCHDNYTLFDRITLTQGNQNASLETRVRQNNLAAAMIFTIQGIPFIHAGEEILRSKPVGDSFSENSYNLPDSVNSIKWDTLNESAYAITHDYYKGLIALRKAHAGLRMTNTDEITASLSFLLTGNEKDNEQKVIAFQIAGGANGEKSDGILVIYNPSSEVKTINLPDSDKWGIYVQGDKAGTKLLGTVKKTISADPLSCTVLIKDSNTSNIYISLLIVGIGLVVFILIAILIAGRKFHFTLP